MFRGLLAFGLAVCVTGAPVVTGLCQAACAMRSADAASHSSSGAHHSCHAEAPASGVSVIAVHICGHMDQLPGFERPEHGMAALAIVPTVAIVASAIDVVLPGSRFVQSSSPPLVALTSQLRV